MIWLNSKVEKSFWKQGRLATFTNWPHEAGTCTPERMAAAGFYAVDGADEHDTAECFICGKQLDGWDADDDPWQEHAKHQSDCPFVLLGKQDELQWTVEELYTLVKAYYVNKKVGLISNYYMSIMVLIK